MINSKKGFTLIELLITIGVLAVLATVVVLVLNPAELFKQARDSQRLSDLAAVRDAIVFTLGTESTTQTIGVVGNSSATGATVCNAGAYAIFSAACTVDTDIDTDGTGWAAVNLTTASGGSPLARLPLDPVNSSAGATDYFYAYKGTSSNKFKLGATLESTKYTTTEDLDGTDGGTATGMYEIGTILTAI